MRGSLFTSEERIPLMVGQGVPSWHPHPEESLQRGAAPHSLPRHQPGLQGAVRGAYGPRGAEAWGLQRVVCGLGWQPGWEESWRFAASHLPELAPRRAGCWDGRLLEVPAELVGLLWLWLS